jgi:type IV secretory pathway VirB3-like protein
MVCCYTMLLFVIILVPLLNLLLRMFWCNINQRLTVKKEDNPISIHYAKTEI